MATEDTFSAAAAAAGAGAAAAAVIADHVRLNIP